MPAQKLQKYIILEKQSINMLSILTIGRIVLIFFLSPSNYFIQNCEIIYDTTHPVILSL